MLAIKGASVHGVRLKNKDKHGVVLLPARNQRRIKFSDIVEMVKRCQYDKVALVNYNDAIYDIKDILYHCETYPDELCFLKTDNFMSEDE